jgi:hypothetical protein
MNMRRCAKLLASGFCLALTGCTDFPEVAAMEGPHGTPPPLVPLEDVLPEPSSSDDPAPELAARSASLKARAAAIGTP